MCFTIEELNQAQGYVLLNEFSVFTYYCKQCRGEFSTGSDFEMHILSEHQDHKPTTINTPNSNSKSISNCEAENHPNYDDYDSASDDSTEYHTFAELVQNDPMYQTKAEKPVDFVQSLAFLESTDFAKKCQRPTNNNSAQKQTSGRGRRFGSKNKAKHIAEEIRALKSAIGPFYCDMCPERIFKNKMCLTTHMKRHIANQVREKCTMCNTRPWNMSDHMRTKHSDEPFKCDICNAVFATRAGMTVHIRSHTGEKPYLCTVCGKSFSDAATLKTHDRYVHTKQFNHKCNECGKEFLKSDRLRDHIIVFHTKERPYSCEICGKNFATKSYLRTHKMTHGEAELKCKFCDKKFKLWENRYKHEKLVHRVA